MFLQIVFHVLKESLSLVDQGDFSVCLDSSHKIEWIIITALIVNSVMYPKSSEQRSNSHSEYQKASSDKKN